MPSLYVVLEKEIPGKNIYCNGHFLSKHNDELEKIAKGLKVTPLMSFFSASKEALLAAEEEFGIDLSEEAKSKNQEKWFSPEEGLRTINALFENLNKSKLTDAAQIQADF